jgi:hypothetical protein
MATVQTKLQFNVRKKRFNSSKLNTGKENADCGNKRSSPTSVFIEHGRKFCENKPHFECEDLHDDGSDSDSDIECIVIKQGGSKAGGKKLQCTKKLQVAGTESTGLHI